MEQLDGRQIDVGAMAARIDESGLRSLYWHGTEVLRGLSAPVRDAEWGTMAELLLDEQLETTPDGLRHVRRFELLAAKGHGQMSILLGREGRVVFEWSFTADQRISVNRAGICLLHPLAGVVGQKMTVTRPDGSIYEARFPNRIAPAQPARDISGLSQQIAGVTVDFKFHGETFEMEDQRNWSDASFKTYCRPLSAASPFEIGQGVTLRQRVEMRLTGLPEKTCPGEPAIVQAKMPEILLAIEPGWFGEVPEGCALLARFGAEAWNDADLQELGRAPWDAEFVIPDGQDPEAWLRQWAERLAETETSPRHVIALPATYLKSHQPEGPWPEGATPDDCARAARKVFPAARIGVGMLTNFTEFNRCPPQGDSGDYVTHGNSAIVHAADDRSVLQTLEALPAIFQSARALGGNRHYRLGLVSIGMRSNPYGASLGRNEAGVRCTMTDHDPRQATDFAATYAIAAAALAASAGVEAICLAAPSGPFSMQGPLEAAVEVLARHSGQDVEVSIDGGFFAINGGDGTLRANATLSGRNDLPPASWRYIPSEDKS